MAKENVEKTNVIQFKKYRYPQLSRLSVPELYAHAGRRKLFIAVLSEGPTGVVASVGDRRPLDARGINPNNLGLAELMSMSTPGTGNTSDDAIRDALRAYETHRYKHCSTTGANAEVRKFRPRR
jgi:hypothetical protein